jgi:hypothetical protein
MESIKKPTTLTELTDDLAEVYKKLRMHNYPLNEVKEVANVAGKIIKAVSTRVAFNSLVKSKDDIPWAH